MAKASRRGTRGASPAARTRAGTAPPASWRSSARWTGGAAVALTLAAAVAYGGGLDAPFVFDDTGSILENPFLTRVWPLTTSMRAPVPSAFAGRPVAAFSLALSYASGDGLSPAAFRLWNLGVLAASSLVLFGILQRTLRRLEATSAISAPLALAVAVLWVLHPLQTEVVSYITQRTESMMGLFALLTLYCAIRVIESHERPRADRFSGGWWTIGAIIACGLGMGTKESMVVVPVLVVMYDAVFGAGSLRGAFRERRVLYLGLAATWAILIAANAGTPRFRSAGFTAGVSAWTYLANQAVMIVTYVKLAIWPHPLVLDYGLTQPIALARALPSFIGVLLLVGLVVVAWFRAPRLAFLGSWFFIALAPSSSLVPIATEVGAERRMHVPLAAVIVLSLVGIRAALQRWWPASPFLRPAGASAAVATIALVFGTLTAIRAQTYRDPVALWHGVLAQRPHGRAHYNLGIALKAAGRTSEALEQYRAALPEEPGAHYALGFELGTAGKFDEAARELQAFLSARPLDATAPKAAVLLGQALARLGKTSEAEHAFRDALRMAPRDVDARGGLADVLLNMQRFQEAVPLYREFLALEPSNAGAHHNLGMALLQVQQESEAVTEFERAVALSPSDPSLHQSLGNALATTGRLDEAATHFRNGLALSPRDARLMSSLALTLAIAGELDEPLALFRRARELAPDDPEVASDYATAVAQWRQGH